MVRTDVSAEAQVRAAHPIGCGVVMLAERVEGLPAQPQRTSPADATATIAGPVFIAKIIAQVASQLASASQERHLFGTVPRTVADGIGT